MKRAICRLLLFLPVARAISARETPRVLDTKVYGARLEPRELARFACPLGLHALFVADGLGTTLLFCKQCGMAGLHQQPVPGVRGFRLAGVAYAAPQQFQPSPIGKGWPPKVDR